MLLTLLRLLALLPVLMSSLSMAQNLAFPHIEVLGEGEVMVVPDIVDLELAVVQTGTDLAAAKQVVDENAATAIQQARDLGVEPGDINATRLMIVPEYQWDGQQRVFQGYRVSQDIHLRLRDTDRYAELLSLLVSAGITELTNTRLDTSRREALEDEALARAAADARRKAERIAAEMGTRVDQVYSVSELGMGAGPRPPAAPRMEAMAMAANSQSVFEPGTLGISRSLRVVFRLVVQP